MRRKILSNICLLLVLIFCNCISLYGQTDTLNQLNDKGKKDGTWEVFLDKWLNPVQSKDSAYFIAYELYDNGERIFKHDKNQNADADSISYNKTWPTKGKPELLDGIFEWFSKDGRILVHEEFKNGWPWLYNFYYYELRNKSHLAGNEILDWSKKYNDINGTYFYEWKSTETVFYRSGWYRKGKRGWRVYEEKN